HALWRFVEDKSWGWAIWLGVLVGLLHAIRETVVLVLIAAGLALLVSLWHESTSHLKWLRSKEGVLHLSLVVLCSIIVSVFFYSGFFTNWQGSLDSVLTYFRYETEPGHEKPWYYYLGLILGEQSRVGYLGQFWLFVLGIAGIWKAFLEKDSQPERKTFYRYIAVYTFATTILYSVIAYKTPWLMLNLLIGWILLSGIGWVYLWQRFASVIVRAILVVVLLASLGHSVRQSWLLGFRFSADPRNPFVYSHTSPDLLNIVDRIEILSQLHPDGKSMRIDIAGVEYWPLPWYLRDYAAVGYWQEYPEDSTAPVQIYSFAAGEELPEVDEDTYITELRGLRDGVFLFICIENELWERQFQNE
ncbi:MAG: hypothetical protein O7C75_08260, partial [Verrucomicrobia bacterium]|nr:hypothetical protein [Verrucomicrobiota bacterium]